MKKVCGILLVFVFLLSAVAGTSSCERHPTPNEETTSADPSSQAPDASEDPETTDGDGSDVTTEEITEAVVTTEEETTESEITTSIACEEHSFSEWEILKLPNCMERGNRSRSCTKCKYVETAFDERLPHSFFAGKCAVCDTPDLSPTLGYNNKITVLYWGDVELPEFDTFGPSINAIENAIYYRNQNAIFELGLQKDGIEWIGIDGDHGEMANFVESLGNSYLAGEERYDVVASYSRTTAHCAINGLLADINAIESSYIDLSQPWWPTAVSDLVIGDSLYYLTGDLSTNLLHMMYGIHCNLDLIKELKLEDPVSLVLNKAWTIDKLISLSEGVFMECNGDGVPSSGDRFGFATEQLHTDAFYHGARYRLIEANDESILAVSKDYTSNSLKMYANTLVNFFATPDVRFTNVSNNTFIDSKALFFQSRAFAAMQYKRSATFSYVFLPTPMLDSKQDGYCTAISNPFTLWAIARTNNEEMKREATALLESFGRFSYTNVMPLVLAGYIDENATEAEIINASACVALARAGIVLDHGRFFPNTFMGGNYMNEVFSRSIIQGKPWVDVLLTVDYASNLKSTLETIKANNSKAP